MESVCEREREREESRGEEIDNHRQKEEGEIIKI